MKNSFQIKHDTPSLLEEASKLAERKSVFCAKSTPYGRPVNEDALDVVGMIMLRDFVADVLGGSGDYVPFAI